MIVVRAEHALHRLAGIAVSASGNCMRSSDLQFLNTDDSIVVTLSGIVISSSPVASNASAPMLFSVEGRVTSVRAVQLSNKNRGIASTPSGITTDVSNLQP